MFKNWPDFNLLQCHVRVLPYEGRQEGVQMDSRTSTKSLSQGPDMLPMHPSLENDTKLFSAYEQWEATSFCFSLLCFSWPHALTYVFPSTMCHRLQNLIVGTAWVGAACCAWWGMGEWSSERSYMMYLDEIDSQTILFKETHTHSTLFCVMNSGAGPHNGIS